MKILPIYMLALVMVASQAQALKSDPKNDSSVFPVEKCINLAEIGLHRYPQDYMAVEEMLKKSKECDVDAYRKALKRQKLKNL